MAQVEQHPDRIALGQDTTRLTYRQLNLAANRLANIIRAHDADGGVIPLIVRHGAAAVIGMMGVLKAGRAYCGLEPLDPDDRLGFQLDDLGSRVILSDPENVTRCREIAGERRIVVDLTELEGADDAEPARSATPDTLSWVSYTSGSTGLPKGVVQNQRNAVYLIREYVNTLRINPDDRMSYLHPYLTFDIFGALLAGARLLPLDLKTEGVTELPDWIEREAVTLYRSFPSTFRRFLAYLSSGHCCGTLRLVHVSGETAFPDDIRLCQEKLPRPVITNILGSNEGGLLGCQWMDSETTLDDQRVPVGYPFEGTRVWIADPRRQPLSAGQEGEIVAEGAHLALGYWNRDDLTHESFACSDSGLRRYFSGDLGRINEKGELVHLGRTDLQVKVRGYRIEPGEIEAAMLAHPSIAEAAVTCHASSLGENRLAGYYVAAAAGAPARQDFIDALKKRLPGHMIPPSLIELDQLPLTSNGKVDRKALPRPGRGRPELSTSYIEPETELERWLAGIWAGVLELGPVGRADAFLDLGGDSLQATMIVTRIHADLPVQLPAQILFEAPTVNEMAAAILRHSGLEQNEEVDRVFRRLRSRLPAGPSSGS